MTFSTHNSGYRRRRHRHGFRARRRRMLQIIVHASLIISKKWHFLAQAPDPHNQLSPRNRVRVSLRTLRTKFHDHSYAFAAACESSLLPFNQPRQGCGSPCDTLAVTSARPLKGDVLYRRTMRHNFAVCRESRARIMPMSGAQNTLRFATVLVAHDCVITRSLPYIDYCER